MTLGALAASLLLAACSAGRATRDSSRYRLEHARHPPQHPRPRLHLPHQALPDAFRPAPPKQLCLHAGRQAPQRTHHLDRHDRPDALGSRHALPARSAAPPTSTPRSIATRAATIPTGSARPAPSSARRTIRAGRTVRHPQLQLSPGRTISANSATGSVQANASCPGKAGHQGVDIRGPVCKTNDPANEVVAVAAGRIVAIEPHYTKVMAADESTYFNFMHMEFASRPHTKAQLLATPGGIPVARGATLGRIGNIQAGTAAWRGDILHHPPPPLRDPHAGPQPLHRHTRKRHAPALRDAGRRVSADGGGNALALAVILGFDRQSAISPRRLAARARAHPTATT